MDRPDAVGEVFNVGAPQEISINALAQLVIEKTGSEAGIVHIPYDVAYERGFEDMQRRFPDIARIRGLTGWQPSWTIEQIDDVVRYERHDASAALLNGPPSA